MSKQELKSASGGPVQKPRVNVYTMMLIMSFLAICIASTLLWMELNSYGEWPQWKADTKSIPVEVVPVDDVPVDDLPVDDAPADDAPPGDDDDDAAPAAGDDDDDAAAPAT